MGNEEKKEKKEKKFRIEKNELDKHEILSLLKGEDISNIEYVDVEILDFAIITSVKYIKNVIEEEKKNKNKDKNNKDKKIPVDKP